MPMDSESDQAVANRRVFVVASCDITRAALQFMLQDEYETHEWGSIDQALVKARDQKPDLLIAGIELIGAPGTATITRIKDLIPGVRLLIVIGGQGPHRPLR